MFCSTGKEERSEVLERAQALFEEHTTLTSDFQVIVDLTNNCSKAVGSRLLKHEATAKLLKGLKDMFTKWV
jgi:hypothetical protein